MTPTPPDYYAILGLEPTAAPDAIKKRYRELARRYHPDVNPSPDAAQKIKAINQAYHVLGDQDRRGLYDTERALRSHTRAEPPRPTTGTSTRSRPATAPPSQPDAASANWEFDGFGRKHRPASGANGASDANRTSGTTRAGEEGRTTASGTRNSATARARDDAAQTQARQAKKAAIDGRIRSIMTAAMTAYDTRNYAEAEALCRSALALDHSVAVAHEMLGDLYDRRGQREDASIAYSYAIQFNPRNYSAQGKLDRLIGRQPSSTVRGTAPRVAAHSGRRTNGFSLSRDWVMGLISVVLFVVFCGALALFATNPGEPLDNVVPWLTAISPNLMLTLVCEGTIGGVLLAFYGRQRPLSQELEPLGSGGNASRRDRKS